MFRCQTGTAAALLAAGAAFLISLLIGSVYLTLILGLGLIGLGVLLLRRC